MSRRRRIHRNTAPVWFELDLPTRDPQPAADEAAAWRVCRRSSGSPPRSIEPRDPQPAADEAAAVMSHGIAGKE